MNVDRSMSPSEREVLLASSGELSCDRSQELLAELGQDEGARRLAEMLALTELALAGRALTGRALAGPCLGARPLQKRSLHILAAAGILSACLWIAGLGGSATRQTSPRSFNSAAAASFPRGAPLLQSARALRARLAASPPMRGSFRRARRRTNRRSAYPGGSFPQSYLAFPIPRLFEEKSQ